LVAVTVILARLALISAVGALSATVLAYALRILGHETRDAYETFPLWLAHPGYFDWWPWPIIGGLIFGLAYLAARLPR
jgi:hypothetical protein